jgi:hypothetical protein
MTYRDRRLARAERLREWSDKRVAFNTQPGHIPERARMIARTDRAFASLAKADRMASRANSIERAAANAIYSDDPDAVGALRAKIAGLEDARARIVSYNRAVRKAGKVTADALELLDASGRQNVETLARLGMLRPDGALPGYTTSNISGQLSKLRARLAFLERTNA